ncbi:MAG: MOSC domain-containing protein [Chloroflexi bacterium]|nr:MOSC domain-containing protein [Chloroflexota bacterium]
MSESGKLAAIWLKRMSRGPMDPQERATLQAGRGLVGNANQGGKRQVTLIEQEVWGALMDQVQAGLDPATRRANLMLFGAIRLADSRNRVLLVGACRIRILGETKPCERMEEAWSGLRQAMVENWGGGAFGEVLDDGEIAVGDVVKWL